MRGNDAARRLKNLLIRDKAALPHGFDTLIAFEGEKVLSDYMSLAQVCTVRTEVDCNGYYQITITAKAASVTAPRTLMPYSAD